jgi:hypothetical protein
MNSTTNIPFLFQKTASISFLAAICLDFFGLFRECVCIHCLVIRFNIHKRNPSFTTGYSYNVIAKFIATLVVLL